MTFETQYQLEEFRAMQPELFDESGKAYRSVYAYGNMEDMLKLINQMEIEIKELEIKLRESFI
jgi:hypothetical protein